VALLVVRHTGVAKAVERDNRERSADRFREYLAALRRKPI
jgi:hypothetical protein